MRNKRLVAFVGRSVAPPPPNLNVELRSWKGVVLRCEKNAHFLLEPFLLQSGGSTLRSVGGGNHQPHEKSEWAFFSHIPDSARQRCIYCAIQLVSVASIARSDSRYGTRAMSQTPCPKQTDSRCGMRPVSVQTRPYGFVHTYGGNTNHLRSPTGCSCRTLQAQLVIVVRGRACLQESMVNQS